MPQIHSRRLYKSDEDDSSEERLEDPTADTIVKRGTTPVAGMTQVTGRMTPVIGANTSGVRTTPVTGEIDPVTGGIKLAPLTQTNALQIQQTDSLMPMSGIVHDTRTNTLSLVVALQSTMQPGNAQATGRTPLIIPAERKRVSATVAGGHEHHHLNLHVRHGLVVFASFCVLMFTMFTLTPLGSGDSGISFFDHASQWVKTQQLTWQLVGGTPVKAPPKPKPQPQQTLASAPAPATSMTDNLALPQSSYVAIAQADAMKYGISPVYFVRQIQQESGFNPYAESPVGAVGIAQFMPATAAGMGVNPYDPVSALNGAAQMMANLSNQYGGDYAKALAAYNAGAGSVNNAVAAGGANWLSYLPAETQNYVRIIMG